MQIDTIKTLSGTLSARDALRTKDLPLATQAVVAEAEKAGKAPNIKSLFNLLEKNAKSFGRDPTRLKIKLNSLVRAMEDNPELISYNPKNAQLILNGINLPNSNFINLMSYYLQTKKTTKEPLYYDLFLNTLREIGVSTGNSRRGIQNPNQVFEDLQPEQVSAVPVISQEEVRKYIRPSSSGVASFMPETPPQSAPFTITPKAKRQRKQTTFFGGE